MVLEGIIEDISTLLRRGHFHIATTDKKTILVKNPGLTPREACHASGVVTRPTEMALFVGPVTPTGGFFNGIKNLA